MRIINESRGTILAERASLARSFWMRFPIGVIFTDRAGRVVGLREAIPLLGPVPGAATRYDSKTRARAAVPHRLLFSVR